MKNEPTADSRPQPIVYVIDDDRSVRAALEDLLASVGLQVRSYSSVAEFLESSMPDAPGCLQCVRHPRVSVRRHFDRLPLVAADQPKYAFHAMAQRCPARKGRRCFRR